MQTMMSTYNEFTFEHSKFSEIETLRVVKTSEEPDETLDSTVQAESLIEIETFAQLAEVFKIISNCS